MTRLEREMLSALKVIAVWAGAPARDARDMQHIHNKAMQTIDKAREELKRREEK